MANLFLTTTTNTATGTNTSATTSPASSGDEPDDLHLDARDAHRVLSYFFSGLGIIVNFLTILAIRKSSIYKSMKKDLIFVMNLLAINLASSVFVLGPMAANASLDSKFSQIHCKALRYMEYICLGSEYCALLLISFNRYTMIVHPAFYRKLFTEERNIILIILASHCICPLLFIPQITEDWGDPKYNVYTSTCIQEGTKNLDFIVTMAMFVVLIPLLTYFYIALLYHVCKARKKVRDASLRVNSAHDSSNKTRKQDIHLAFVVVAILTKLSLTYLPYFILSTFNPRGNMMLDEEIYNIPVHLTFLYLRYSNNFTNAILYLFSNAHFRKLCKTRCKLSSSGSCKLKPTNNKEKVTRTGSKYERNESVDVPQLAGNLKPGQACANDFVTRDGPTESVTLSIVKADEGRGKVLTLDSNI